MIHKKHFLYPTLLAAALWCVAPVAGLHAQDGGDHARPPHGPPPSPLFDALDTNHDGVISADEIANASTALKAMLKNGATQITREDVRPPRPPFDHQGMRPHGPSPTADQAAADASSKPDPATDDAQAEHPHHRPQPPEADSADQTQAADHAVRPHADMDEQNARPPHHPHGPPPSPLFDALDTNHDGVISADEMANAAESLKKLERNGSNGIKREDLNAMRPPRRDND